MKSKSVIEDIYPLSPMQQGILFHSLYSPETVAYFIQVGCTFQGALNVEALQLAWEEVVQRHAVLRTAFNWEHSDEPFQIVYQRIKFPWTQHDWRSISAQEQDQRIEELLQEDRKQGFDFTRPPLMRITLVQLSEERYRFLWSYHHLLMDGWSSAQILAEVFALYEAHSTGQPHALALSHPYGNYIGWLQKQSVADAERYWRKTLQGFTTPTTLKEAEQSNHQWLSQEKDYAIERFTISEEGANRLRSFCQQYNITLNSLFQGAWGLLLSRYKGTTDVAFGSVVSGRSPDVPGVESIVGLFFNTLPTRLHIVANTSLIAWLRSVQEQLLEMRQFEYSPLMQVQNWSELPRDQQLFDHLLVFQNYPMDESLQQQLGSVAIQDIFTFSRTNYPLTLVIMPGREIILQATYDCHCFTTAYIQGLLRRLHCLIQEIIDQPQQSPVTVPLLTKAELRQMLVEWNATASTYPQKLFVHQLFEHQAALTPDSIAVVFEDQQITYRGLNECCNQVAQYLQATGIGPETFVGICMERSLEIIIAVYGVLKAGAAYLPLDPQAPSERLAYMIADAQAPLVLTQSPLKDKLSTSSANLVCLDTDWSLFAEQKHDNPLSNLDPANQAYMIYTSGSTGKPKGVVVEHRHILNYVYAVIEGCDLTAGASFAMLQPITVDACKTLLFPVLCLGGTLHIISRMRTTNAQALAEYFHRTTIDGLKISPSHWIALANASDVASMLPRRWLILGGEGLRWDLIERIRTQTPSCRIFNHYGPTETTVGVSVFPVRLEETDQRSASTPIGWPLPNTQMYLLNRDYQPVPVGIPGELYIGGSNVVRGYLDRPDLTAEKFIPDMFGPKAGARLYKTGDLARYHPDGKVEFLGRMDDQVKIRAYRIELSEIEAVLSQHSEIRECIVLAREDSSGEKRLVAYLASLRPEPPSNNDLRSFLLQQLPDYMVPATFVWLDALPLTTHGKVDRRALPMPEDQGERPELLQAYVAPRTALEQFLAETWQTMLKVDKVGIHDNFFELGGDSIKGVMFINKLQARLGEVLYVVTLFDAPTIADLARYLCCNNREAVVKHFGSDGLYPEQNEQNPIIAEQFASSYKERIGDAKRQTVKELVPSPRHKDQPLPLSFAQQRLWFLDQLEPMSSVYNIPHAMRLKGQINYIALEQSLAMIVQRHEVMRTSFATRDGQAYQVVHPFVPTIVPIVDLTTSSEAEVQAWACEEAKRPFDLSEAPLWRITLLHLGHDEHVVLLIMHHIISDGWSTGILLKELFIAYGSLIAGKQPSLPSLPLHYADFAAWQRHWLQGETLEELRAYWMRQLGGQLPMLHLPTDYNRPAEQTFHGKTRSFFLPKELLIASEQFAQVEEVTLFILLLTAFNTILYRYTGQEDLVIGTPASGRPRQELEQLIGFFVNTLVLRTQLSGEMSFRDALRLTRHKFLEAYTHQEMPFEMLIGELNVERNLGYNPLFQVLFVFQNTPMPAWQLPGLTMDVFEIDNGTATFDLTFSCFKAEDGLIVTIQYKTDLFLPETIERLVGHFQSLLESAIADDTQSLCNLPLMTPPEYHRVVETWNNTSASYPRDICIHQWFEQQVQRTPDAIALVFGEMQVTYLELDQRSNQLARYLQRSHVTPDTLVGIYLDRSLDMMISILAVLKAGGAYVPLDPSYPEERLAFMMRDANARIVVTHRGLRAKLPPIQGSIICIDQEWSNIARELRKTPPSTVTARNLAYVIYTSGSTGVPHGVAIEHRSLVNETLALQDRLGFNAEQRILQFISFSFDACMEELFLPLSCGASLLFVPNPMEYAIADLLSLCQQMGVTTLHMPTSYWTRIVDVATTIEQIDLSWLQLLIVGAEKPPYEKLVQFSNLMTHPWCFVDAYGPTEATITATLASFPLQQPADVQAISRLSIGGPIGNVRVYVLDTQLRPVPVGVSGELYIGGMGVARGYLHLPALTAERFIPDPFSTEGGERLYKTNDSVRYGADGSIEFLGRRDDQVKVRGYRIELGEIESILRQHSEVREVVVLVREDVVGDKRIIAYLCSQAQNEQTPTTAQMRSFLKGRLPEYMLPSAFVWLEIFPLTANGKIDRQALPVPQFSPTTETVATDLAQSPLEDLLTTIWADVLHVPQVGIHDNFFNLGGDSILSIQIVSRCRQLGITITPKQLFQYQTVATLASVAEWQATTQATQESIVGQVSLTPIQAWFFEQELPESHHWNQGMLLKTQSPLDYARLEEAVRLLMQRHEALRLRFEKSSHGWQQSCADMPEKLPCSYIDLTALPAAIRMAALEQEATMLQASLNLASGPILRVALFELGAPLGQRLLIIVHHLGVDSVSWRILTQDLEHIYQELWAGRSVAVSAGRTTPFTFWAQRLRDYATSATLVRERSYWLDSTRHTATKLPLDFPDGENTYASAEKVLVELDQSQTKALLQEVPSVYHTQINDALLTALAKAIQAWHGGRLLVNLEGHGRAEIFEQVDLSQTVGWFTTFYPLLLDLSTCSGPGEELKAVKEQLRAVPNQGIGYLLLRYLSPEQSTQEQLRALPQAQISFNYLGQFDQGFDSSALFQLTEESAGTMQSEHGKRQHLLEVASMVSQGKLIMQWTYSRHVHARATIEKLAQNFLEQLRLLIAHCQAPEAGGYTPSDFSVDQISQKDLDHVLGKIRQLKGRTSR